MPAEAILAPRWTNRASLYFDLTDQAVGGLGRSGCQSHGNWMLKDGCPRRNDCP
jgi:hypothetical protein